MLGVILLSSLLAAEAPADLLPDLILLPDPLSITRLDTTTRPGRTLLRMTTMTPNAGLGRLELRGGAVVGPALRQVNQRIYRTDGTFSDRPAGTFTYHPTHLHFHFDGWAEFRLRAIEGADGVGPIVASGEKQSFCVLDSFVFDDANPGFRNPPYYRTCGATVQGITPGWGDVYDLNLPDQWVDVTGVPDGFYWLEGEVDPDGRILEEDESNNAARLRVWLGPPPPALPDRFEENDTPADVGARPEGEPESPNLGLVNARREIDDLSMEDPADYFRFRMNNTGDAGDFVRIESAYLANDIDLVLLDGQGRLLDRSVTAGVNEQVSLEGRPAGDYLVLVGRFQGENPGYRLVIDPAANRPPSIEVRAPGAPGVLVERAFEGLLVEWTASDPDGDPTRVSLFADRDGVLGKDTLALGGYQDLPGATGAANVNTAGLGIGTWRLYARITDGGAAAGAWAPGEFTVYAKGDVDFSGSVDEADFLAVARLFPRRLPPGWAVIADMDRDGDVDGRDIALLRDAARDAPAEGR